MEVLKTILKSALQAKSSTVSLKADHPAVDENDKPINEQVISSEDINDLSSKFFPSKETGVQKSKINIKSVGTIFILGNLDTHELYLFFPPDEKEKCDAFISQLSSESNAIETMHSEEPSEDSLVKEPVKPVVDDDSLFKLGDDIPIDLFAVNAANIFGENGHDEVIAAAPPAPEKAEIAAEDRQFPDPKKLPPPVAVAAPVSEETVDGDIELVYEAEMPGESTTSRGGNPIDKLLKLLIEKGGSDLHLTAGVPVCMRIDGDIVRINDKPITFEYMRQLMEPLIPTRNRGEFSKSNDTDFAYEITNVGRFRVNLFRDRNGIGSVLRVIPSKILTATDLDLPPAILKFGKLSKGLVVVTGPTGSGKSTTLAAIVDWINKNRTEHILTIEDPIEFVHQQQKCLINHREIGRHTTSFTRALRAALREDPDIVLIGEMRDLETVAIGIETAETGHLVFGTLHTNTAVSTVDRIVDQFPEGQQSQIRMMLSESLKGVVAQTLLKKKGGGRIAAHEILVVNDAVGAMIREGKTHMIENHMQTQKKDGNLLLNDCLIGLVERGLVDADHALLKSIDKESLMSAFTEKGIHFEKLIKIAS